MKLAPCATLSLGFAVTRSKGQIKSPGSGLAWSEDDGLRLTANLTQITPIKGCYYLIAAQIDGCLVLLKLMFMLLSGRKGVFPPWFSSFVAKYSSPHHFPSENLTSC